MEIKSLKETSLKKYKDNCNLIIGLSFLSALFAWNSRHDIGSFNAGISILVDLTAMILAFIALRTKSKLFVIMITIVICLLIGIGLISFMNGHSFSIGGLEIVILIVSFFLYIHLSHIYNNYDKYTVSFNIQNDENWEKIKLDLKKQYIPEGYKEIRNDEKVFTLRKDNKQYVQLLRNKLKCNLSVVGTKKPIIYQNYASPPL